MLHSTEKRTTKGAVTPIANVNNPINLTQIGTNPMNIPYIADHINNTASFMHLSDKVEAQTYLNRLAIMAGEMKEAHYVYHCNLVDTRPGRTVGSTVIQCSDMEAEGWKRCFDTYQIGVMPMSAASVRQHWFDTDKDGYPASASSKPTMQQSAEPSDDWFNEMDDHDAMQEEQLDGEQYAAPKPKDTPSETEWDEKCALESESWLNRAEHGDCDTARMVALAGGTHKTISLL